MHLFNRVTKLFVLGLALAGTVFTAGCNTVEGAGKDIEKAAKRFRKRLSNYINRYNVSLVFIDITRR